MDILILMLQAKPWVLCFSFQPCRLVIGSAYSGAAAEHARRLVLKTYAPPREEARARARLFLAAYPKAAYMSEVESWRELPGGGIEFAMRRLIEIVAVGCRAGGALLSGNAPYDKRERSRKMVRTRVGRIDSEAGKLRSNRQRNLIRRR
jgi:hypothetical protein